MDEAKEIPADQTSQRAVLSLEAFIACDFEAPIAGLKCIEPYEIAAAYRKAATDARSKGRDSDAQIFMLLNDICSMCLRPEDRADVWGSRVEGTGWRSALPTDFKGEQSEVFLALLDRIKNPVLRARLADVVWTNSRSETKAAIHAISAYSDSAEGLLAGTFVSGITKHGRASFEASKFAQRGLQIAHATSKKGRLPDNIRNALKNLYACAKSESAFFVFSKVAELGVYYELLDPATVAGDAEAVACSASSESYPMAVKAVLDLAARLYTQVQNEDGKRRCQIGAVDHLLAMRSHVSSAGAQAHWVMEALQALKHIKGVEDKETELEQELRRLQKASLREMKSIPIDLNIGEDRDAVVKAFEDFDLPAALFNFALLDRARPIEDLRKEALQALKTSPVTSMFSAAHIDGEGRTVKNTPGADGQTEPDEDWFRATINMCESLRRLYTVASRIEPARQTITQRFTISEDHLAPIVGCSPLIPQSQQPIVALGIARFLQGDFMSATYLLLPQIEPCLRHILKLNGHDPSKRFSDSTEEDFSLSGLIDRMRAELEAILTQPILSEIELLFDKRPGPALRHEMAHGQIGAAACFHPDVIYACWLIYRLCCLPLLADWEKVVKRAIQL